MAAPHRVVDEVVQGIADGVNKFGDSLHGAVTGAGESIMSALDTPFKDITGKVGPHRIIDSALDGVADATRNAVSNGALGSLKIAGEGLMKGLDNPAQQLGFPPDNFGVGRK